MKTKEFNKLSKTAKRIAIAKDVIKQLKAKKFFVEQGSFLRIANAIERSVFEKWDSNHFEDLQTILNENKGKCTVCALGGLFASCVGKEDNFNIDRDYINLSGEIGIDHDDVHERLSNYFQPLQLAMIEVAFEKGHGYYSWVFCNTDEDAALFTQGSPYADVLSCCSLKKTKKALNDSILFGAKYKEAEDGMIAIMKNIVKNKGVFKP